MVELFYVRAKHHHRAKLDSDVGLQYRFHGRYGVNVPHCILGPNADATLSSFGGGFELMKTRGDKDGVWAILESGLQFVSALGPSLRV